MLNHYKMRLEKLCDDLENFCERNNILYVFVDTKTSLDDFVLRTLRREKSFTLDVKIAQGVRKCKLTVWV